MAELFLVLVGVAYFGVILALFIYGLNFFYLTFRAWRDRPAPIPAAPPAQWPRVTVQLPIYNELYVVERLVDAVAQLDYPPEQLQIQVLDDSTDETVALAAEGCDRSLLKLD